jgi:hypothetical protein
MHYIRIHVNKGTPMPNKRKFEDFVSVVPGVRCGKTNSRAVEYVQKSTTIGSHVCKESAHRARIRVEAQKRFEKSKKNNAMKNAVAHGIDKIKQQPRHAVEHVGSPQATSHKMIIQGNTGEFAAADDRVGICSTGVLSDYAVEESDETVVEGDIEKKMNAHQILDGDKGWKVTKGRKKNAMNKLEEYVEHLRGTVQTAAEKQRQDKIRREIYDGYKAPPEQAEGKHDCDQREQNGSVAKCQPGGLKFRVSYGIKTHFQEKKKEHHIPPLCARNDLRTTQTKVKKASHKPCALPKDETKNMNGSKQVSVRQVLTFGSSTIKWVV